MNDALLQHLSALALELVLDHLGGSGRAGPPPMPFLEADGCDG
jgi:hypothetical protein